MFENRVPYYAGPPPPQPQLEALLVDRDRMIRMLRIALAELHARRLTTPDCTGETDIIQLLRYWDDVFGWIKQQHGMDIVLMNRRNLITPLR